MYRDFYATMAQVLPVVLLALVWESNYLERLRSQPRKLRRDDPVNGVWFWTKPRVRVFSLVVTGLLACAIAMSALVLAGILGDAAWLRGVATAVLVLALVTLLVRIGADVVNATK